MEMKSQSVIELYAHDVTKTLLPTENKETQRNHVAKM